MIASGGVAWAELPSMKALAENERAEIRYQASGCFAETEFAIAIVGGEFPYADIETVKQEYDIDLNVPEARGRTTLSSDDLEGLDELLLFYRGQPSGACTSDDTVEVRWTRNGKLIDQERFIDSSCKADKRPGRLTLPELLQRVAAP